MADSIFPYKNAKVPIVETIPNLQSFLDKYANYYFCLYLAYKDDAAWDKSTSRVYMNQVLSNLIYVPVNIQKDDYNSLRAIYNLAEQDKRIIGINQTQPHKSNPVIMEYLKELKNVPTNIDTLIKNEQGKLLPYDLNGPSFVGWFNDEVESFTNKKIVLIGVGGAGEPIARRIIKNNPAALLLVDPNDKKYLEDELSSHGNVKYYSNINSIQLENKNDLIIINTAGKEGATDDSGVYSFIEKYASPKNIFVDLRPHLDLETVNKASELGWRSYTGYGMNARNDYSLVTELAKLIQEKPPTFDEFKKRVTSAS